MSDDSGWDAEAAELFRKAREEAQEPPAPAELYRVRAALQRRLSGASGSRVGLRLAVASFALAAIGVAVWSATPRRASEPGWVVAEGSVLDGDLSVRKGEAVGGARLVSTGQTAAVLALGDQARVQLEPATRARLTSLGGLELLEGRLKVHSRGAMKMAAGAVTLEAAASVFEVAAFRDEVQLHVSEGVVYAVRGSERVAVKAPDRWPAVTESAGSAPDAPKAGPPSAPVPREQLTRLEQAAVLTQRGRLEEARAIYVALAAQDAPVAELALYHLARLEQTRAHKPQAALLALDEQLRRFPDGALAREGRLSRIEALRALGLDAGE